MINVEYYEDELKRVLEAINDCLTITGQTSPTVPGEAGSTIATPTQADFETHIAGYQSLIELVTPHHSLMTQTMSDYR